MGYSLLREAVGKRPTWTISERAYVVLLYMALTAMDKDSKTQPARHYFGGWTLLAMQLGYPAPEDDEEPLDWAAEKAVNRAIRELVAAGLVKSGGMTKHRSRRTRIYVLTY